MRLHYKKLLIASIAVVFVGPLVSVVVMSLAGPAMQLSRESHLRVTNRRIRSQVLLLAALHIPEDERDEELQPVLDMLDRQYDAISDIRVSSPDYRINFAAIATLVTAITGLIGTFSSILLSWRRDARDASRLLKELQENRPSVASP